MCFPATRLESASACDPSFLYLVSVGILAKGIKAISRYNKSKKSKLSYPFPKGTHDGR